VTANASNEIQVTFDFEANPVDASAFGINGQTIDMSSATSASAVVTAVNNAAIGDIRAEANADGTVKLS